MIGNKEVHAALYNDFPQKLSTGKKEALGINCDTAPTNSGFLAVFNIPLQQHAAAGINCLSPNIDQGPVSRKSRKPFRARKAI